MRPFLKPAALLMFILFAGVGCISFSGGQKEADGGIWKSGNQGEEWQMKKVWPTAKGIQSIGGMNITSITLDSQDHLAVYAGTTDNGLMYSYDGGESWQQARSPLASGRVTSVSVDAKNKCTIYVTMGPRVWKTTDCNRTYTAVYFETRTDVIMTQVEVDWFNSSVVYAATSSGDVLKSTDSGANWASVQRFENRVVKIFVDQFDSRTVYVGLKDNGIWKTTDGGATWVAMNDGLREYDRGRGLVTIAGDAVTRNTLLIATRYGILRTTDGGVTWQPLNLPTPPNSVTIFSLAVSPRNVNEIYYGTASTFYRSLNGGANWSTNKLPTTRAATAMLVDPQDPKVVYLGATLIKK
ncbi:MAG: hypothetical protein Q8P82_01215 [bacterium]|nr:hypothetical protein [bacterium]